jgi:hypothetical protein
MVINLLYNHSKDRLQIFENKESTNFLVLNQNDGAKFIEQKNSFPNLL